MRKSSDEQEEDEDGDVVVSERIEKTKKKRKIIESVQTKRGLDTSELVPTTRRSLIASENAEENAPSSDVSSNYGILDRKHRKAMEDYVNSKLDLSLVSESKFDSTTTENNSALDASSSSLKMKPWTEEALYSELAEASRYLSGKVPQTGADADKEDSGSGGAVLVGGTGIAEVILPVSERLKLEQATEEAKAARYVRRRAAAKRTDPAPAVPSAIPNRFSVPSSFSNNNQRPSTSAMEDHFQGATTTTTTTTKKEVEPAPATAVDDERVGFEALKQQYHGISTKRQPQHKSNDQRVFQNFVTRQREMNK